MLMLGYKAYIYIYLHCYSSLFFWLSKRMFTQTYPSDTQLHCVKTSTSFGNYSKFFFPYLTMIHVNTPTSFPSPPKYQDPVVQRADKAFRQIYSYQQDNCFSNVMPNYEQRFIQQIALSPQCSIPQLFWLPWQTKKESVAHVRQLCSKLQHCYDLAWVV